MHNHRAISFRRSGPFTSTFRQSSTRISQRWSTAHAYPFHTQKQPNHYYKHQRRLYHHHSSICWTTSLPPLGIHPVRLGHLHRRHYDSDRPPTAVISSRTRPHLNSQCQIYPMSDDLSIHLSPPTPHILMNYPRVTCMGGKSEMDYDSLRTFLYSSML
jgi:hypothetical protein